MLKYSVNIEHMKNANNFSVLEATDNNRHRC